MEANYAKGKVLHNKEHYTNMQRYAMGEGGGDYTRLKRYAV